MDDFSAYANMVASAAAQNNAWSAEQAQKQMDFQERMSSTAHQREVADLKAAGLNPVLSAKLGGASTPTGAMGSTDTSLTSSLVELLEISMETANSAASAAKGAVTSLPDDHSARTEFNQNMYETAAAAIGDAVGRFFGRKTGQAVEDWILSADIEWDPEKRGENTLKRYQDNAVGTQQLLANLSNAFKGFSYNARNTLAAARWKLKNKDSGLGSGANR